MDTLRATVTYTVDYPADRDNYNLHPEDDNPWGMAQYDENALTEGHIDITDLHPRATISRDVTVEVVE